MGVGSWSDWCKDLMRAYVWKEMESIGKIRNGDV